MSVFSKVCSTPFSKVASSPIQGPEVVIPTNYQIIANYGLMPNTIRLGNDSGRTDVQDQVRQFHKTSTSGTKSIKLAMAGIRLISTGAPVTGVGNDYTAELAFEKISPASSTRLLWSGLNSSVIPNNTSIVLTDALTVDIAANETFALRENLTIAADTMRFPDVSSYLIPTDNRFVSPAVATQLLNTGAITIPGGGLAAGASPVVCILGIPDTAMMSLMIVGDSIANGSTDNARGYIIRGLENVNGVDFTWHRQTVGSASCSSINNIASIGLQDYWQYATHMLFELGVNDCLSPRTLAEIQTDMSALWAAAKAKTSPYGVPLKVYQSLITPGTTSSDSFATAANQTVRTGFEIGGKRDQLNDWIIAQVALGTINGYYDPNTAIEDPVNHGKWLTNGGANTYTADGIHPASTATTAMAPIVNTWAGTLTL